jgi:hypothetical protein
LKCFVNGKRVPVIVGSSKFVCLRLGPGLNRISFVPGLLPLEKKMLVLAGAAFLILAAFLLFRRRVDKLFDGTDPPGGKDFSPQNCVSSEGGVRHGEAGRMHSVTTPVNRNDSPGEGKEKQ